tara:strand:+ start:1192 stop:1521 length:330 start_codon:yes stop_codon:yes gene_type:complete
LLAFAISMAPLAGSWAADAPCTASITGSHAAEAPSGERMPEKQKAPETHCDEGTQHCPPEFCAAKCFPSMHLSSFAQTQPQVLAIDPQSDEPTRLRASPDRLYQPPPRT